MSTELVHVGFGNVIAMNKVLAIVSAGSEPITRMIQAARGKDLLIDLTSGRRTKAVIIMESGHIIVVALNPETIAGRVGGEPQRSE
jgi:hypothetical protein